MALESLRCIISSHLWFEPSDLSTTEKPQRMSLASFGGCHLKVTGFSPS